jgi:hypothetical protein
MKEKYQMTAKNGDIVLMPSGVVGVINHWDIVMGGNCKEVRVYPLTNWLHRLILTLTSRTWFYDDEINHLKPLILAAE